MFNKFIDVAEIMRASKRETSSENINHKQPTESAYLEKEMAWRNDKLLEYRSDLESHKIVGTRIPEFGKQNKIVRKLLKFIAKAINKIALLITREQNIVNDKLILSCDRLRESVDLLRAQVVNHENKICSLENENATLKIKLNSEIIMTINRSIDILNKEIEVLKAERGFELQSAHDNINDFKKELSVIISKNLEMEQHFQIVTARMQQRLNAVSMKATVHKDSESNKISLEQTNNEFDEIYKAFENSFRGSQGSIKGRLKGYVDTINSGVWGGINTAIDLGCGRGEWLQLLQDEGIDVEGIDLNAEFVEMCRSNKLKVTYGDVLAELAKKANASVDLITGFHLVEHLNFNYLNGLIHECSRVLKPNGILLFETPNAQNVTVGSYNFYNDPTHASPIHHDRLKFQMEYHGFVNLEDVYWDKASLSYKAQCEQKIIDSDKLEITEKSLLLLVNEWFNSPGDYTLVGRKA